MPPHRWHSLGRDQRSCRLGQDMREAWSCQAWAWAPSHLPLAGDSPPRALQMVRGIPSSSLPAHALAGRQTWAPYVILRGECVVQREQMTCPRSHSRQVEEQTFLYHLSHLDTKVPCFPAGPGSGVTGHRWRGRSVPLSAGGLWPGHLPCWASGSSPIHND